MLTSATEISSRFKVLLILFHSRYLTFNPIHLSIKLDKIKLFPVEHLKYLGMFLDNHLTWEYHINQLSKKFSQAKRNTR